MALNTLFRKSKVSQLDIAIFTNEHILRLEAKKNVRNVWRI